MEMHPLHIVTRNQQETFGWGKRLASLLEEGDIVALYGELGSGKTVMAQGICEGLEVDTPVTSPSFTLIQEYIGRLKVYHFDFYRLESLSEIESLDIDSYFEQSGVCIVEWAEKGDMLFPDGYFKVHLDHPELNEHFDADARNLCVTPPPGRSLDVLR